jgi:glycosyltransferase involved in cell wall biosynthesis
MQSDLMQHVPAPASAVPPKLSVVVPIYDEEESIPHLVTRLFAELDQLATTFEVIAVDDGSKDGSGKKLAEAAAKRSEFKVVTLRRNAGQTAALMAGLDHASGEIIITIDADLQNDPKDIPLLLAKLAEGFDVVSGWRKDRQDAAIRRNFVSRLANRLISWTSGVHLHDYGCTLKAYRRDVLQGVRLYGEMHRFVPIYAAWMGAKVVEIPVRHHARQFGKSKYGLERTLKVVLDLIVVKFFSRYMAKPIYVFGGFGALAIIASVLAFLAMVYLKFARGVSMILTPLPVLSGMLFLVGIMSILMGILAEIMVRTYFESQGRLSYTVRDTINF